MRTLANQSRSRHMTTNRRKGHRELDSFPVASGHWPRATGSATNPRLTILGVPYIGSLGYGKGMEAVSDWITPAIVIAVSGLFWRHLVRIEQRFDRRFDRVDHRLGALAREVAAKGRAIARLEGRHEGHPLGVGE